MMQDVVQTVLTPLQTLSLQVWSKIPAVLGALVLLLIGSLVGRWLRYLIERMLNLTNLDSYAEKIGLSEILHKLGVGRSPVTIVGFLVYWLIFLAFLLSAANVVQLNVVSEFLQQIVLFMPKLIAAVLILGGGLFLGHFLSEISGNAARANDVQGAEALSKATFVIVVVFSAVMALERLGIDTAILSRSVQIVLASVGFGLAIAFGLAFGLAGKDMAANWLRNFFSKQKS